MDDMESNSDQQHKPPQEDLSAKDIHYRRLFETARDGILVVDAETGNIIDVNPFLIDTLGYARQDLINKPIWELGFLKNVFSNKNKFEELKQQDYLPLIDLPLETPTHGQLDVHLTGNSYEVEHRKLIQLHFQVVRERKEAESKLLQSEQRFHQLIEEAPIGIALSQQGKTVYANSRYLKMFGFEGLEELIGTSFLDQIAPLSRVEVIERAMQQEQGETVNPEYDIQGLRKDGSQFPFQATISRVELENEPALIGYFTDVTQRKKAEEELRAAEDRFRLLAENAKDLIFRYRLTPPQGYEYVSPSALKIVGYTPEEYYNDPALGLRMVYPEDRFNVEASMLKPEIMPNGPILIRCIRKDGKTIWLEQINTVIRDGVGQAIAIQGIARDITERKAIEEQLGNVLIHQKTILSAVPDIIMEVDNNKVYTWANQAGVDFFGDDVIGKEASYYFVGEQDTYKIVQPVFDGIETNVYLESWQRRKDGQKRLLAWWSRSMKDAQGSVIGGLSAANDITDRYNAEQDNQILRQKAEMSTRLAAVGEMAAGIAHEINNPLTGIIGFSELLLERTELPKEVRDDLNIINDGSIRVKEIVSRMLTFARQTKPHKSSVSINELLENTLELRSYVLKTSNIQVVRDYDPNLPSVTADAGQLQQVFLNIIVNAEYAMKKENGKGTLTIKTREFDRYVSIFISDDGPGMSAEIKAKLFQPFFTTKDPGEGTGLGLSLSHGIIQEHLGNIKVESTPGKGTTFIIELPITPLEIEPENLPFFANVVEPIKRARVLVVDDEPAVRSLIKTILTRDGHIVEECGDSSQVIETLKETTFDILLVDLRMPGMDGMELYSEISSLWPKLAHNVIFITGDTSDLNTRQYLSTHQIPFIAKPFDRNTLLSVVNSVLLVNQTPQSDPKNPQ